MTTTPRIIQAGYTFREGFPSRKMDADAVGRALEALEAQSDDGLDLKTVVEAARDVNSPLFAALTTDEETMADKLHLIEVRDLVGAICYRVVNLTTEEEGVGGRVFTPTGTANKVRRIAYIPAPYHPPEPKRMVVTKPTEDTPPQSMKAPLRYAVQRREVKPLVIEASLPEGAVVPVLTREKAVTTLTKFAERLETDPFFDEVVLAIRRLSW